MTIPYPPSLVAVVATMALIVSACSAGSDDVVAEPGDLRHIHDFALRIG